MKRFIFVLITIIMVFAIQVLFMHWFSIHGITPDIFLHVLVFISIKWGAGWGESLGFFSGLLQDFLMIKIFGAQALLKTLAGFFVGLWQKRIDVDNILTPIVFLFASSMFYWFGFLAVDKIFSTTPVFTRSVESFVIYVVYNTLLAPISFFILGIWQKIWDVD